MQQRVIPAFKSAYLDLLRRATAPEFDIPALTSKIKHEMSLTYQLLRYLNSAAFGLRTMIHSIPYALSLLGERELRKWIAVVAVRLMADRKSDKLKTVSLVRGRFCELFASRPIWPVMPTMFSSWVSYPSWMPSSIRPATRFFRNFRSGAKSSVPRWRGRACTGTCSTWRSLSSVQTGKQSALSRRCWES
jgi:hypothetical protein